MMEETKKGQEDVIKVKSGIRGKAWEMAFYGDDHDKVLEEIDRVYKILESRYGKKIRNPKEEKKK